MIIARNDTAAAWVVRKSFRARDLPRQLWGLLGTSEFRPLLFMLGGSLLLAALGWTAVALVSLALTVLFAVITIALQMGGEEIAFTAQEGEQLIAGLRARLYPERMVLMGVYVEPAYRQRGIAGKLFAEALDEAERLYGADVELVASAATHPASKTLVYGYLGGRVLRGPEEIAAARSRLLGAS